MLKEMTIKIITEQDEQEIDSMVREKLFGVVDISEISFENIDHCEEAKIHSVVKEEEKETGLTPDQIENYIGSPNKCPFCGSEDISADSIEPMDFDSDMTVDIECRNCGKEWREFYRLYLIEEK
jgi:DNA-directed RNA polymerase subunit M/transcription elongation factor TFIIS